MNILHDTRPHCLPMGIALVLLLLSPLAHAQDVSMQKAEDAYQFADYDQAITLFSEIAQSAQEGSETQKTALRYLGRAYVAKDQEQKAQDALRRLIKSEPPLVELNPDMEPPPLMKLYYKVRKEIEGGYGVERKDPGLQTLAIMGFTNSSVDENNRFQPLRDGLPSMMINYLQGATDLKVIERERIEWLLDELELQGNQEIVDQSSAVRAGKLLGVNAAVFGSYTVHNDRMWLSARVVKVETGEILLAEQLFGEKDEFFELIQDLSLQVSQSLNVTLEETELGSRTETKSLDAMMAYSDGLALVEQQKYREAYEKFLQAKEYDPDYKRAEIKAQSLKPMLAQADAGSTTQQSVNH